MFPKLIAPRIISVVHDIRDAFTNLRPSVVIMTRKARPDDLEYFYSLYMHPQVNPFLLYELMPIEEFKPIYTELQELGQLYVFEKGEQSIGMFKLVPFTHRASHIVYLGGLAIDPSHFGKGYGKEMMEAIKDRAKADGFLRIELSVEVANKKAIKLYKSAGFELEGLRKNYSWLRSKNEFLDELFFSFLFPLPEGAVRSDLV